MQARARLHELLVYLSLRPTNYLFGRIFRFSKIVWVKPLGYIVNDAEVAKSILNDSEHFSIKEAGGLGDLIAELWGTTPMLLSMDGGEHKRVKYTLLELFKAENLPKIIEEEIKNFQLTLQQKLIDPAGVDIVRETRLATNHITTKILGVTGLSDAELLHISGVVTAAMDCIDIKQKTFTKKNRQRALGYVGELKEIAQSFYKNVNPTQDSIISRLKSLGYDDEAGYGFVAMFIIAGTVTVSSALPRIVRLLIDTGQFSVLKQQPELIPKAVSEGLRYTTPGPVLLHGVKADTQLAGKDIKAGNRIIILLYNIMHDKRYTPQPFRFIADREQNSLISGLWFGTGAHFCMGSVLAQLEISAALETLASSADKMRVVKSTYMHKGINPGYESLVIKC